MTNKTLNPIPYDYVSVVEVYKNFTVDGNLYVDINTPYDFLVLLEKYCPDGIKIVLIDVNQQKWLLNNDFNRNGTRNYDLDNLDNIYVQKYVHKLDSSSTDFTNLKSYVKPNEKYSKYVKDLIVDILSIVDIPFEKLSELIKITNDIEIPKERICEIYQDHVQWKIFNDIEEIQNEIKKGNIELSGVIHYDEQFLWVKHQPYARLTIIDAGSRVILQDIVIPREKFNKYFIKKFLTESIEGFEIDTIITDGYRAYNSIIEDLGLKHQVCVFHKMKVRQEGFLSLNSLKWEVSKDNWSSIPVVLGFPPPKLYC